MKKHLSLLGLFVSFDEELVLWIWVHDMLGYGDNVSLYINICFHKKSATNFYM